MTAIREYPFDFSDQSNGKVDRIESKMPDTLATSLPSILCNVEEKRKTSRMEGRVSGSERKVSIMTNEPDKDKDSLSESRNGRLSSHQIEGSSRWKSNHHHTSNTEVDTSWDRPPHIEGKFKKYSTTSTIYSKKALSYQSEPSERSWIYACCQKCHQEEAGIPSWEPPYWQKFCPYPFCPTFRKTARVVIVCMIGLIVWVNMWLIMGETAAPGGQLFKLAALTIAAHLAGVLVLKVTTLPGLIGMLLMGILLKNVGFVNFDGDYQHVVAYIRKIALTILLIRAGMDLDPNAMKKHFLTVIKLSLIPWSFEFFLCVILVHYIFGLPWDWACLLGSIVAAVSPAVIVPCLLRLRNNGYGVSKGIPTLVLAVSGIDDAASVAVFGIVFSVMFSSSSLTMTVVQGPLSVVTGIAFGVVLGYFVKFVPERSDAFVVPLRVLFLLFGGILSMLGFDDLGWGGGGPLAVITFAFVASKNWGDLGWDIGDNPVVTSVEIFWMFFEPMLFSVTGAQVVISELPGKEVLIGSGILVLCAVLRAAVTSLSAVRSNLNLKEKIFVGLAWMAKATVQAALAPVALDEVYRIAGNTVVSPELENYGKIVVNICVLSIVLTAPIGAIIITFTGPKLLSRTTKPPILEGWRRSNRPSIRDISIIDEEEVAERIPELPDYHLRPESPAACKEALPPPVIVVQPSSNS